MMFEILSDDEVQRVQRFNFDLTQRRRGRGVFFLVSRRGAETKSFYCFCEGSQGWLQIGVV